jgi:hypothetical protein
VATARWHRDVEVEELGPEGKREHEERCELQGMGESCNENLYQDGQGQLHSRPPTTQPVLPGPARPAGPSGAEQAGRQAGTLPTRLHSRT